MIDDITVTSEKFFAADLSIDMLNKDANGNKMVYSNEVAQVEVGDTVTWLPASKCHNVEFIAGPDGFDKPKKSKMNNFFEGKTSFSVMS